jgi:hypothetical protein
MDRESILKRLDYERRTLRRSAEVIEILPHVTRLHDADKSHLHTIIFSSLTNDNADAIIAEQIAHYRAIGKEVEWKLYAHDLPSDLSARLRLSGFTIGPEEAVLVLNLQHPPTWITAPATHDCIRVDDLAQVDLYRRAAEEIFKKNYAFTAGELAAAIRATSTEHRGYLALADNQPISIGRLYTHPDSHFAGLYGGGTIATHRGQGFYRATVAARARDAIAAGAKFLIVDALPTSRPILQRLGFEQLTQTWPCTYRPA